MVEPSHHWFNWYLAALWSMNAPIACIGVLGAHHLQRGAGRIPSSRYTGTTDRKVVFTIPSLCTAGNTNALRRVLNSIIEHAPRNLDTWRIDVVAEEGAADKDLVAELGRRPHVRMLVVPSAYETPNGAKFKSRANHFAMEERRRHGENNAETYVYHLDDDTHIGPDTVASLAEFIETNVDRYYLAQGTLSFPRELTRSRLAWYCDAVRPTDDLTRFAFFTGRLGRPLGGLHGEHVIIRSDVEDEIGWDFADTVIEDAYFALEFAQRYPGRSTTLNSCVYGASPSSVIELIRQRRRWSEGLLRLVLKRSLPWRIKLPLFYMVLSWSVAPWQFMPLMVCVGVLLGVPPLPPALPIVVPWAMGLAGTMWLYIEGVKVNVAVSSDRRCTWWRSALCIPGVFLFAAIECYAVVLGLIRFVGIGRQRHAEAIAKPL
ncbi:MAG: glycosyltransferase family 2 protein [Actinobacteria bacterium]|nr:glycosyltransferase family 2 protein [Actinomycetota bacterium]